MSLKFIPFYSIVFASHNYSMIIFLVFLLLLLLLLCNSLFPHPPIFNIFNSEVFLITPIDRITFFYFCDFSMYLRHLAQ